MEPATVAHYVAAQDCVVIDPIVVLPGERCLSPRYLGVVVNYYSISF